MSSFLFLAILYQNRLVHVDWATVKDIVNIIKDGITATAIIVGGIWAYFNFIKGRIYHPRLEPEISGKILETNGTTFVIVRAGLKNIGLSKIDIKPIGLAIVIYSYQSANVTTITTADKLKLATFPVFEEHEWIEPGELIEDEQLFQVPQYEGTGIRVELRFVYNGIEWNTGSVAQRSAETREERQIGLETQ